MRDSERAISEANRTLVALEAEGREVRAEALAIAERRRLLERSLGERSRAIGRMLAARQAAGAPDALRVALSGEEPAQVSRTLHYVSYVTRASASMLGDYRAGIAEAERLAREAQAKRERLRSAQGWGAPTSGGRSCGGCSRRRICLPWSMQMRCSSSDRSNVRRRRC